MPELTAQHILHTIAPTERSEVVLALSGGLDSMVLLHLLVAARKLCSFQLSAVYINHGISDSAAQWGEFCQQQCKVADVAFTQVTVQLCGQANLENNARQARYAALQQFITSPKHVLVTAHHADDQIESLLLALKRGAGPAGLAGIAKARAFSQGKIERPLLPFSRAQLADYAAQYQLTWVEDDSNTDTAFDRNFIRHTITPVLKARWPHFLSAAQRSIQHLANLQDLADYYTAQLYPDCVQEGKLNLKVLQQQPSLQQDLLLRHWLKVYGLNPSTQWLQTLFQDVINARHDASPVLMLAGYQIRRFDQHLYILNEQESDFLTDTLSWHGESVLSLPENIGALLFLNHAQAEAIPIRHCQLNVEFGKLSLPFKPASSHVHKPLKQWFKLWRVPPWQRGRIPLLVHNNQLIAVAGFESSCRPQQARYYVSWQR